MRGFIAAHGRGGGMVFEGPACGLSDGLEIGVIGEDAQDIACDFAELDIFVELLEAMWFFADQQGYFLA